MSTACNRSRLNFRPLTALVASVVSVTFLAPACSGSVEEDDTNGLSGGSSATAGTGNNNAARSGSTSIGVGGSLGSSGASSGGRGGSTVVVVPEAGAGGADEGGAPGTNGEAGNDAIGPDDACALSTETVEALPSVLELVVDTSGSMDWPPGWEPVTPDDSKPPGATKWDITRDALASAVASLDAEVVLGANFFPNTTGLDDEFGICLRNEAALPIAPLGPVSSSPRAAWQTALDDVVPSGGTPTEGGYLFGLEQLADSKFAGNQFVLLITDGTPTCTLDCECNDGNVPVDSKPLLADAKAALKDGVHTFVIGSPGSENTRDVLSALAREGGTAKPDCSDSGPVYCHFDMTTEPNLAAGLERALADVAASLRTCEYPVPKPPGDRMPDPDRVNVLYTPSGGKTQTIARDPSATDCHEGWQYTDGDESIVLCGDACEAAKSDVGATVQVVIGCKTVSHEPH
jgi:Mg-chelatase subunit ChlD